MKESCAEKPVSCTLHCTLLYEGKSQTLQKLGKDTMVSVGGSSA